MEVHQIGERCLSDDLLARIPSSRPWLVYWFGENKPFGISQMPDDRIEVRHLAGFNHKSNWDDLSAWLFFQGVFRESNPDMLMPAGLTCADKAFRDAYVEAVGQVQYLLGAADLRIAMDILAHVRANPRCWDSYLILADAFGESGDPREVLYRWMGQEQKRPVLFTQSNQPQWVERTPRHLYISGFHDRRVAQEWWWIPDDRRGENPLDCSIPRELMLRMPISKYQLATGQTVSCDVREVRDVFGLDRVRTYVTLDEAEQALLAGLRAWKPEFFGR